LKSKSIDQTTRDLGIPISTFNRWVKRLSQKQHHEDMQDVKTLHKELKQFCKELSRTKEAPTMLKKAPAYIVK
jgi:transposase-like protein